MNPRRATTDDIPTLARFHRLMFEEIWDLKGQPLAPGRAGDLETAYAAKLAEQLPDGRCVAWVVEADGRIVAGGAITIVSFVPSPVDLGHWIAYLHSIYTETTLRGRGLATEIVERAIDHCRAEGIGRMILGASEAGKPIYEKLGFVSSPETMRLLID